MVVTAVNKGGSNRLVIEMVIWFAIISLLPLGISSYFNFKNAEKELNVLVLSNLAAITKRQSNEIKTFLKNQERFVSILSLTSDIIRSLVVLNRVDYREDMEGKDANEVEEMRRNFAPILQGIVDEFGFYQMFLINKDGRISFSVGQELAAYFDLNDPEYEDYELSKVYKNTLMFMTSQVSDFCSKGKYSNINCFYLATPVMSNNKLLGIIAIQIDAKKVYEITQNYVGLGGTGETLVGSKIKGKVKVLNALRYDREEEVEGKVMVQDLNDETLVRAVEGERGCATVTDYDGNKVLASWEYLPRMRWGLVVKIDQSEAMLPVTQLRDFTVVVACGTLVFVLVIAILVSNSISKPIVELTEVAGSIARGDLTPRVSGGMPNNEIGLLAQAIEMMALNLKSLASQVKESVSQVSSTVTDVSQTVQEQGKNAHHTESVSVDITSSARRISVTAKELAGTMREVNEVAQDTALLAESGIDGLQLMQHSMGELSSANSAVSKELELIQKKANAIGGIITTMTKVADQTSLLSLNADIEARKAKEAGRGFRVVAKEIHRLAHLVAGFTLEIEGMINEMLIAVTNGVGAMVHLSQRVEYGVREINTVSNHLGNVIQQVQGLPPRFEMVLQGMQSQVEGADSIKELMNSLNMSAQRTVNSLDKTTNQLEHLIKTAANLQKEVARFQT